MSCSFHIHIGEQKAKLSSWAPMSFSIYQDDDRQGKRDVIVRACQ